MLELNMCRWPEHVTLSFPLFVPAWGLLIIDLTERLVYGCGASVLDINQLYTLQFNT